MKTLRLLSLLLLFTLSAVHSQKIKTYKAWVTLIDESEVKGVLYSADDKGILLVDHTLVDTVAFLDCENMEMLKIRRKGSVGKGALIGAASGMAVGAIIGFAGGVEEPESEIICGFGYCYEPDPPSASENALAYGAGLAVPGTAIGALIGSGKKKYELNGDSNKYLSYLQELRGYALKQN